MMEKTIDLNSLSVGYSTTGCSNCHNFLKKYKYLCITCKSPCLNCTERSVCNTSTDTYDFEKYLESLTRKPKLQVKVKTVGTDTCDLDSHFDYYKIEKASVIQKSVATDCADLNYRKLLNWKRKNQRPSNESSDDPPEGDPSKDAGDCRFSRDARCEPRTYSRCGPRVSKSPPSREMPEKEEDNGDGSVVLEESIIRSEENKENYDAAKGEDLGNAKEIDFELSSSDESDLDLVTSSKVSKCRKIARTNNLRLTHVELEEEEVFRCNICGKTFPKKYLGVLHLGNHVEDDQFKCLSCERNFPTLDSLTLHVKELHHSLGTNNSDNNILLDGDEGKADGEDANEKSTNSDDALLSDKFHAGKKPDKGFHCALCSTANDSPVRFPSYKALYRHKRLKHGVKEIKHRPSMERKPRLKREFICLFCGKEFKSNKALNDHLPVHTGEKNHLCDICNKSYTTSANLQIHKRTHMGLKNFKCTLCDKAFHKKDSLKVHFRKHSGERPFQCDLCPMRFDRNFILKNHRLRHFSEKTYICPVCGKAFTTHGGLNNHEKSHKRDPGLKKPRKPAVKPTLDTENAVICDVCGKVYSTRSNLRIHKFVHLGVKPFQCPVCQQSYAKKDSMLTHMRKHTDERPFSCETCGMAFYRNHTLKTHRLRHTGERPHKCHMCGKSFTQSSSLTYHIKHHNRKDEKKVHTVDDQSKGQKRKKVNGAKPSTLPPKSTGKDGAESCASEDRPGEMMTDLVVINDDNGLDYQEKMFAKNPPLILPIIKKEVLVLNESITLDHAKKDVGQAEIFEADKDDSQFGVNKFNYFIAKNHVLTLPKDDFKGKVDYGKDEVCEKDAERSGGSEETGEGVIIPKGTCVGSEGSILAGNREVWTKGIKGDLTEMIDHRSVDGKTESVLPIAGEILNATFISDENGEVIPFGSMTLQSVNAENIMISPLIKVESADEGDRPKGLPRCSRVTVIDSKVKYHSASPTSKAVGKANCQILNLKDARVQQRIQLINSEPLSFHIQVPVSCTAVTDETILNGIASGGTYYSSV